LRNVYGQIVTTIDIATEFGDPLPDWVEILQVSDKYRQQLLELQIDRGESSALALEIPNSTVFWMTIKPTKLQRNLD
jgi:predicted nucleic acid-binding protein